MVANTKFRLNPIDNFDATLVCFYQFSVWHVLIMHSFQDWRCGSTQEEEDKHLDLILETGLPSTTILVTSHSITGQR